MDRMLHYGLLVLLAAAFLISLAAGLFSLSMSEDQSLEMPESASIAPVTSVSHARVKTRGALGATGHDGIPLH
ncbi:MAG: hypothetical protein IT167_22990 [Bryobacterales bacterium]|nr:hypothetical protein [Bryobacterales bacterium]